jgi:acetate kinase
MRILVPNIGSTSLKWKLFDFEGPGAEPVLLHKGGFERVTDYASAVEQCLTELTASGALASEKDLAAVGFKTIIAKGINGCVRIDERVLQAMEEYRLLAPAHNPPYIAGIRQFAKRVPRVPLIALFETAFCQPAPEAMMRYAVPDAWHEAGVRRWGFHGASHRFVTERALDLLSSARGPREDSESSSAGARARGGGAPRAQNNVGVITCHLGGSSSIAGSRNGVAIGSSMGMSPQSGLPQNNRVGDLDCGALPYVMRTLGLSLDEAERQLTKDSGLKGLSGLSNDIRDIEAAAAAGNTRASLALDVYVASARHWIGAYFFELGGADAIVFTAGIGENSATMRGRILAGLDRLGIVLDSERNAEAAGR